MPITVSNPTDPDGEVSNVTWQWSSAPIQTARFVNIPGATGASYTPITDLIENYLRVTAAYTDSFGPGKTVSATSEEKVGESPNQPPVFSESSITTLTVDENAPSGTQVGDPFSAVDPEGEGVEYSLDGTDAGRFGIDSSTGQMSVDGALDFEAKSTLSLNVVATDTPETSPSPSHSRWAITVNLLNVDEPGSINLSTDTPETNVPITAALSDPDGGISDHHHRLAVVKEGSHLRIASGRTFQERSRPATPPPATWSAPTSGSPLPTMTNSAAARPPRGR